MHSPYAPPNAPVKDNSVEKGSAIKAVILGLLVDIVGTTLSGFVLAITYGIILARSGATKDEIINISQSSWTFISGVILGCLFSIFGGYICARIAKHSEYKLGGIMSVISIALGLMMGSEQVSLTANIALAIATCISIMTGIWLGISKNTQT